MGLPIFNYRSRVREQGFTQIGRVQNQITILKQVALQWVVVMSGYIDVGLISWNLSGKWVLGLSWACHASCAASYRAGSHQAR